MEYLAQALLKTRWQDRRNPTSGNLLQHISTLEQDLLEMKHGDPDYFPKQRLAHQLYVEMNMPHEAFKSFGRFGFAQSDSDSLGLAAFSMQMHHLKGGVHSAEDFAHRALGKDPTNTWALLSLLEMYEKQGKYKEAMEMLNRFEHEYRDEFLSSPLRQVLLGRRYNCEFEFGEYDLNVALQRTKEENWVSWVNADRFAMDWKLCLLNRHRWLNVKQLNAGEMKPGEEDEEGELVLRRRMTGFDGVFVGLGMLANGESYSSIIQSIQFLSAEDFEGQAEEERNIDTNHVLFQAQRVGKPILYALALIAKQHRKDDRIAVEAGGQGLVLVKDDEGDSTGGLPFQDEFAQQDAFVALFNVRNLFPRLGGLSSHVDVLDQTLLVLALRAARYDRLRYGRIAQNLSLERVFHRPFSVQSWQWRADILHACRDPQGSNRARNRARDLEMAQH